jgi:hypothetical protein
MIQKVVKLERLQPQDALRLSGDRLLPAVADVLFQSGFSMFKSCFGYKTKSKTPILDGNY